MTTIKERFELIDLKKAAQEKGIKSQYLDKQIIQKKVCMTKDIGVHGNLFGGNLMQWIDEAAAGFVSEAIGFKRVVTLKVSEVLFKAPVKVNDIINIDGEIIKIGRTSVTINIEVVNVKTEQIVCTTEMVFVRVGDDMKPKEI